MKLNHKLLSCPSNLKFNKINSYYNRLLPIFEKVLFTLNITSSDKMFTRMPGALHVTNNTANHSNTDDTKLVLKRSKPFRKYTNTLEKCMNLKIKH